MISCNSAFVRVICGSMDVVVVLPMSISWVPIYAVARSILASGSMHPQIDVGLWNFPTIKLGKLRYRLYCMESTMNQQVKFSYGLVRIASLFFEQLIYSHAFGKIRETFGKIRETLWYCPRHDNNQMPAWTIVEYPNGVPDLWVSVCYRNQCNGDGVQIQLVKVNTTRIDINGTLDSDVKLGAQ